MIKQREYTTYGPKTTRRKPKNKPAIFGGEFRLRQPVATKLSQEK